MVSDPEFQVPVFPDSEIAYTFESDDPTRPFDQDYLNEIVDGEPRFKKYDMSWTKENWKFLAAAGAVAVSIAGVAYHQIIIDRED